MLDPDTRSLYTDSLKPPPGFAFDRALATTYSLDLETLLTVPLHLVLFSGERNPKELLTDRIALLEALRRTASSISVYCQQAQIHALDSSPALVSLLESVVVEARAHFGVFHPKLWVLRFRHWSESEPPLLRLLVLSRNLTMDHSWDVALSLEGRPAAEHRPDNAPFGSLLERLHEFSCRPAPRRHRDSAVLLADEIRRTRWELPDRFESVRFHALGLQQGSWAPARSKELVVISPFLSAPALDHLARSSDEPVALISRPESLAQIEPSILARFSRCLVLDERAEIEDGEETTSTSITPRGLHAKVFVTRSGWNTHIFVGSANATNAALLDGINVEVIAELIGKRARVGEPRTLLDGEGLGAVLTDYVPPEEPLQPPPEEVGALEALEAGRRTLSAAGLRLVCAGAEDEWRIRLHSVRPVPLNGIASLRVWQITQQEGRAVDGFPLTHGEAVELPVSSLAAVSAFVAFELRASAFDERVRFVLNLPLEGLPADREAAVLRSTIQDPQSFLRYLLLLLAELGGPLGLPGLTQLGRWGTGRWGSFESLPLLEEMTRALCRDPLRLHQIRRLITELDPAEDGSVVPLEFLELWSAFDAVLEPQPDSQPV